MKQKLLGAALVLVLLTSCVASRNASKPHDDLDGRWQLAVYLPSEKKTLAEVFGERVVELRFNKKDQRVSGTTGCNRFAGTYSADTASFAFSQLHLLTKMACAGYDEQLFLTNLKRVNHFRIVESQLELLQNEEILLIFAKRPE